jgi:hypothetical protein
MALASGVFATMLLLVTWLAPADSLAGVGHVIHVSVDGVNASTLEGLMDANAGGAFDNWNRLRDEGAHTFNARTDYTHTVTIPNHVSMVTGRPVLQPTGQVNTVPHLYTNNGTPGPTDTLHDTQPYVSYVSSTFDVAHDAGLSTALYASKSKFIIFEQTYNDAGSPGVKIDDYTFAASRHFDAAIDDAWDLHGDFLVAMAGNDYDYAFLHYTDPDKAGHLYGWASANYDASLAHVDGYLGDLLDLVESDPDLAGDTVLIVGVDHGGGGPGQPYSHTDPTRAAHYTIPFFVWGPGIAQGRDLYDLNAASRTDPGTGRPDYDAVGQPIRNGDGGNLALDLLDLSAIPGSTINAGQDLRVEGSALAIPSLSPPGMSILAVLLGGLALFVAWTRGRRDAARV